jgi:hypothetical protein
MQNGGDHRNGSVFLDLPANCYYRADAPPRTPVINGQIRQLYTSDGDTEEALRQAMRQPDAQAALYEQMLAQSLAFWCSEMMRGPDEEPFHGKFVIARHHIEIDEAIRKSKRVLVEAARGHGKSELCSVGYPIWKADRNLPGGLVYIFSGSQTLAEERLDETKKQLERNPKMSHLLPSEQDRKDGRKYTWNQREINLVSHGRKTTIRARGCGVRVRGGHPHAIVCDDLLDDDCLYSETRRRKAAEYFFSVPTNMINPVMGQMIVIGTPFTQDDLYSKIKKTGEYVCLSFPARDKATGKPLFPERYSAAALKKKEQEIGPARFSREFLVMPVTDLSSLFPSHLFDGTDIRLPYVLGLPHSYWAERGCTLFSGVDIAMSAEVGADYFVIFTIAVDPQGVRWIANITREKGVGFDRQLQYLEEEYALMRPDCMYIEANQAQRFVPQEMIRKTSVPIRYFFTSGVDPKQPWKKGMTVLTQNKHSLDRGVPSLRMGLENRKWRMARGDENSIYLTDVWKGELACISYEDGKIISAGEHDDVAMASWFADSGAKHGGAQWEMPGKKEEEKPEPTNLRPPTPQEVAGNQLGSEELKELKEKMEEEDFDPFGLGKDFLGNS